MTPAEHRGGERAWTRADVIHLANTLPLILEDVEEGEAGYGDLEAVILRAFADVGHPLVPADRERVLVEALREIAKVSKGWDIPGAHPNLIAVPQIARAALDSVQDGER